MLEKAEAKVDALKARHDDLHVLIDPSSVLLKEEPVEVSSVRGVLYYLSNLWAYQEGERQVKDGVNQYCLPKLLSPKDLTSRCFSASDGHRFKPY